MLLKSRGLCQHTFSSSPSPHGTPILLVHKFDLVHTFDLTFVFILGSCSGCSYLSFCRCRFRFWFCFFIFRFLCCHLWCWLGCFGCSFCLGGLSCWSAFSGFPLASCVFTFLSSSVSLVLFWFAVHPSDRCLYFLHVLQYGQSADLCVAALQRKQLVCLGQSQALCPSPLQREHST